MSEFYFTSVKPLTKRTDQVDLKQFLTVYTELYKGQLDIYNLLDEFKEFSFDRSRKYGKYVDILIMKFDYISELTISVFSEIEKYFNEPKIPNEKQFDLLCMLISLLRKKRELGRSLEKTHEIHPDKFEYFRLDSINSRGFEEIVRKSLKVLHEQ